MSDRWFNEYRLMWIKESIEIFGFINRRHIQTKFKISAAQAAHDLRDVIARWPDLLTYNKSLKQYELKAKP